MNEFNAKVRETVERAQFHAALFNRLTELRDMAFELLVTLKDRQDAKRGAK